VLDIELSENWQRANWQGASWQFAVFQFAVLISGWMKIGKSVGSWQFFSLLFGFFDVGYFV